LFPRGRVAAMTVILALIILFSDHPEPFQQMARQPDIKTCTEQAAKLLQHPIPKNARSYQVTCIVSNTDEVKT